MSLTAIEELRVILMHMREAIDEGLRLIGEEPTGDDRDRDTA